MKITLIAISTLLLLLFIALLAVKSEEVRLLRKKADELQRSRISLLEDKYEFSLLVPNPDVTKELKAIYVSIAAAYTNEDVLALHNFISRLPRAHDQLHWQVMAGVRAPFVKALNDNFLCIKKLNDFRTVEEFERYAKIGTEAARFYGESNVRRKSCEIPIAVEYLTFNVLKEYRKKFHEQGRRDLESAADRYLKYWIARIEGLDGLTRQCAWHTLKYNTVYIKALKPEKALSEEQGVLMARATAIGLIRCGYRPNWVDVDFPLPAGKADPLSSIKFHSWDVQK